MSLEEVLKCGSNLAISPPWATTSSFFCVVWAWAAPGESWDIAPATPRAAAPLSSSRRVTVMRETSLGDVDTAGCGDGDRTCVGARHSLGAPTRAAAEGGSPPDNGLR